jgi:hypothetical protein
VDERVRYLARRVEKAVKRPGQPSRALQIVTRFKHKASGDTYLEAWKDFDDRVGNVVSALRDRGELVGELGETIDFVSPPSSIVAKRILLVGLGEEKALSLDSLRIAGRVAVREANCLRARRVSFAPVLRDQGSSVLDVGEGDRAVVESVVLAYDTEKRLQAEGLAEKWDIVEWIIDAGPTHFDGAVEKVGQGIAATTRASQATGRTPL